MLSDDYNWKKRKGDTISSHPQSHNLTLIKMGSFKNGLGNFNCLFLKKVWSGDKKKKIPMPTSGFLASFKPPYSPKMCV